MVRRTVAIGFVAQELWGPEDGCCSSFELVVAVVFVVVRSFVAVGVRKEGALKHKIDDVV